MIRGKAKAKESKERVRAIEAKVRGRQVQDHPRVDVFLPRTALDVRVPT